MRTVDVFSIDLLLLMKLFSLTLSRITSLVFPILDVIWFIKRHGSLIGNSLLCSLMVMYVSVSSSIRTRHGLCYQWFCWLTFLGFSNVFLRSFSYWSFSVGHCIDLNSNVSLLLLSLLSTLSVILHNNQKAYYRLFREKQQSINVKLYLHQKLRNLYKEFGGNIPPIVSSHNKNILNLQIQNMVSTVNSKNAARCKKNVSPPK